MEREGQVQGVTWVVVSKEQGERRRSSSAVHVPRRELHLKRQLLVQRERAVPELEAEPRGVRRDALLDRLRGGGSLPRRVCALKTTEVTEGEGEVGQ